MGCGVSAKIAGEQKLHPSIINVLPGENSEEAGEGADQLTPLSPCLPPPSPISSSGSFSSGSTVSSGRQRRVSLIPKSRSSLMGIRTAQDEKWTPEEALKELQKGNRRFWSGNKDSEELSENARSNLANAGQSPIAAIIGCADSRVPIEIVFDANPGELFVLRNAGNTCMCAEGSVVGSLEYCIGNLGTPLVLVMGHTKCGALAGAAQMACRSKCESESTSSEASKRTMLQSLLMSLESPVQEAVEQLPDTATLDEITAVAIRCNVFHTMRSCLRYSDLLREKVNEGSMQVHGAVYDIMNGHVEWLGPLTTSSGTES